MDGQRIQKRNYSRKRGKGSHFGIGDKVLKKDFRRKKREGGALDPKWPGPYEVMKDIGKGLFLMKRCDDGKVDRAHGDHLKVFVVPKQIEYSHKPTVEHQKSYMSMQENHIVENDSNSHESAYEDCSGESEDEIMQYEDRVSQQNAIDNATLQEQLYSSSLLRLWRSGACTQIYEAEEDDEYFDVSYKFLFQYVCVLLHFIAGNTAESTRRRIRTKQGSSCFFVDRVQRILWIHFIMGSIQW